eukprot:569190-Amphidinium_carterae.2
MARSESALSQEFAHVLLKRTLQERPRRALKHLEEFRVQVSPGYERAAVERIHEEWQACSSHVQASNPRNPGRGRPNTRAQLNNIAQPRCRCCQACHPPTRG